MSINKSFGFWSHAKEFLSAATKLKNPKSKINGRTDFSFILPAYYLVGHSIELSLKSFLTAKGYKINELKSKYGHNLEALLSEARLRKLDREVKLSKSQDEAIKLLSKAYNSKKFEYLEYGNYHLPKYWFIHKVARKLVKNLENRSSNSPFNKALKQTKR